MLIYGLFSCIYRGRDLCYKVSSKLVSKIFMYKKDSESTTADGIAKNIKKK